MKKRSLRVKEWRGRKRAQGLRPLSLWLDTATYGRLQAMAEREQVSRRYCHPGIEGYRTRRCPPSSPSPSAKRIQLWIGRCLPAREEGRARSA
jgi:hypothetical protein